VNPSISQLICITSKVDTVTLDDRSLYVNPSISYLNESLLDQWLILLFLTVSESKRTNLYLNGFLLDLMAYTVVLNYQTVSESIFILIGLYCIDG
jgi:hypothetical protein